MTRLLAPAITVAPAVRGSGPRTVPNLPGALTRQLSARLSVDATTAMRVALLYGDIEWLAGDEVSVRYSASDYARRQGLHRHTVMADIRRLIALEAISAEYDRFGVATFTLHGLLQDELSPGSTQRHPGRTDRHPPGRAVRQAHVEAIDNPLSIRSTTLENSSKKKTKKGKKGDSAEGSASKAEGAAAPDGAAPAALLDRLLENFRQLCPAEWSAPERITLSAERSSKISKALAFAGSSEALERRLRSALAQVPPWYRTTYPQRPDGSRRPAHQFFDVLFRAAASERDCGVEAWHLFAWSEATCHQPGVPPSGSPAESELERARSLFYWDSSHWCGIGIPALELSLSEKRRLTELLEAAGLGDAGTAARQYAEPSPDAPATCCQAMPLWRTGGGARPAPPAGTQPPARHRRLVETTAGPRPQHLPGRGPGGPRQAHACAGGRR